jgi:hypothetical protein
MNTTIQKVWICQDYLFRSCSFDPDEQLHSHDQLYQPELQHLRMIKTNKVSKQHDKIMSIKSALNKVENVNKR